MSATALRTFLNARRAAKGKPFNVTGMNKDDDIGIYNITDEDYPEFLRLHHDHVFVHSQPSSLLERHTVYSPILIDLDFRYTGSSNTNREFEKKHIRQFVHSYAQAFCKFIDYNQSLRFFVELKLSPTIEKNVKKDGIHIICPDITVDYNILLTLRKYLLDEAVLKCFPAFTNTEDDCFDEAVIQRNNWFLHGATKPEKEQYNVVYCFIADPDGTFDETEWDESNRDMTSLFSIRLNRESISSYKIKEDMIEEWNMWEATTDSKTKPKSKIASNNEIVLRLDDDGGSVFSNKSESISKLLKMNGCVWEITEMTEGYKLTHNAKTCLVETGVTHSTLGHSCLFVKKECATFSCFSHNTKRLPKTKGSKLWKILADEEDELDLLEKEYNRIKLSFESNAFRILDPPGYMVFVGEKWIHYNRQQLTDMNSGIFLDDDKRERFIDWWLRDETIRTYDRMGYFVNNVDCPLKTFNMFTGFAALKHKDMIESDISAILNHVNILCNHNENDMNFILDWFAQIVQQPNKLPGICIVINGQHGCGKDIFLSWFGTQIIGVDNYFKTARPNIDLFGAFNSSRKNIVFYHIEEGNSVMLNETNIEQFKNYITDEYASIQLKQKDNNALIRNYNHFAISTNSSSPFKIEPTERRFFGIQASNEKCRDSLYFSQLSSAMSDMGVVVGFYNYLLERDISGRDWKNPPQTEYMKSMISASLPDVFHFVNEFIEEHESDDICVKASEFYETYKEWCRFSELKPKTLSAFGNSICTIKGICKTRKSHGMDYIINKLTVVTELSKYF
jgi:hypothetical protein